MKSDDDMKILDDFGEGDIETAHTYINDEDKSLLINREPSKKKLFNKDDLVEFEDESLPKKESMGQRPAEKGSYYKTEGPRIKHQENKSSRKAVEDRLIRRARTPVGKKHLPLDADIPYEEPGTDDELNED